MIVLSQTTDKIQVVLGSSPTTQADCVASWRDITSTPTYVAGRSVAQTNNTTDVDLVAAPAASTQRVIDYISVYNKDTGSITVTVKFDANGNDYVLWTGVVGIGKKLEYVDSMGFVVLESDEYTVRLDDTGTYTYVGQATPGTAEAAAVWQVKRITNATTTVLFADGNANFDNVWNNRASLSYS